MKYRKTRGYKFILHEDERFEVPQIQETAWNDYISLDKGILIVKKGYAWDGSSVPFKKSIKFLFRWDVDKYTTTSSLQHDAFCQLMREGSLPKPYKFSVDLIYKFRSIKDGLNKKMANIFFKALRKFGDAGINKDKYPRSKVYEV